MNTVATFTFGQPKYSLGSTSVSHVRMCVLGRSFVSGFYYTVSRNEKSQKEKNEIKLSGKANRMVLRYFDLRLVVRMMMMSMTVWLLISHCRVVCHPLLIVLLCCC